MLLQNNPMWTQLAEREKRLVIGLVIFLMMVAFYALVWSPISSQYTQQKEDLQKAEAEWLWLVEQAPKVVRSTGNNNLTILSFKWVFGLTGLFVFALFVSTIYHLPISWLLAQPTVQKQIPSTLQLSPSHGTLLMAIFRYRY